MSLVQNPDGSWTLPQHFRPRKKQKPQLQAAKGGLSPSGRPSLREVHRRHRNLTDRRGRPYWLPHYRFFHPEEDDHRPSWEPAGCLGPLRKGQPLIGKRRFLCDQVHFCAFCWERRCRQAGLWAALHHAGQDNATKFSVSLPGARLDPQACRDARKKVARTLRRYGFDRITLYIHTYGENPADGAKGHLDGFASGPDADVGLFDVEPDTPLWRVLRPFHERPDAGFWQPHISHRAINDSNPRRNVKDLILAGFYAGRPTFPTRRVLAGLYGEAPEWSVRMTNVTRKSKLRDVAQLTDHAGRPVPDWSFTQTLEVLRIAEEWRQQVGRPLLPRSAKVARPVLKSIIEDTRWRTYFRLPTNSALEERYL